MKEKASITFEDLKQIRADLGMTQKQLAEKLSVSFASVRKWEQGYPKIPKIIETLLSSITKKVATKKTILNK
jgi:DNA-binding transcriptional regulator YiaG